MKSHCLVFKMSIMIKMKSQFTLALFCWVCFRVNGQCYYTGLCYTQLDKGVSYRGNVDVSKSGKACVPWGRHLHNFTPDKYRYEGLEANYCRNPLGRGDAPWCYINQTGAEQDSWEYCNVPKCDTCLFRGVQLKQGDRFHDGCSMCVCQTTGVHCLECPAGQTFTSKMGCYVKYDNSKAFPMCCPKIVCHGQDRDFDMTEYFNYLQFVLRTHAGISSAGNVTDSTNKATAMVTVLP